MQLTNPSIIVPDWPAPDWVQACSTTRLGGVSIPPYQSLNLGTHVNDDPQAVQRNRQQLLKLANLPESPRWLEQVHGTQVVDAHLMHVNAKADASYTDQTNIVCTVMTADCLPVLFCNQAGTQVAAAHAGWRGLLNGVLENTLAKFTDPPSHLMAWLGPAIGPKQFEVGVEVYDAFCLHDPNAESAFKQRDASHYLADIYQLARLRLARAGLSTINGGGLCTMSEPERFFSYRRDGQTGRMASLIWIKKK